MKGAVKFQYVTSESNPADLLTKPLAVSNTNNYCNSPVSLHSAPTRENPNTMNKANLEKGIGGAVLWQRKEGAGHKELEEERRFLLLRMFLHPVGKCESALFFLLASVFPTRFSLQRFS